MATPQSPDNAAYSGLQQPGDDASKLNAMTFLFRRLMSGVWTSTLVLVKGVQSAGEVAPVGFVDVQPMVHQIDGAGSATPHGIIHNLPYFRIQGGANAVILDPQVGDIGLAIFASRDISAVKSTKQPNIPGSRRQFNPADGLYIGGFLNAAPEQYVRFSTDGLELVSPSKITLQAPDIQFVGPTHTTGAVTADSTATFAGEVKGDGHSLSTHKHGGVQTGSGQTGNPIG